MRLIDANALHDEIWENKYSFVGDHFSVVTHDEICDTAMIYLENAETIDAVPVRHGRWDRERTAFHGVCSECGAVVTTSKYMVFVMGAWNINYCPNCGAKMEEVI